MEAYGKSHFLGTPGIFLDIGSRGVCNTAIGRVGFCMTIFLAQFGAQLPRKSWKHKQDNNLNWVVVVVVVVVDQRRW